MTTILPEYTQTSLYELCGHSLFDLWLSIPVNSYDHIGTLLPIDGLFNPTFLDMITAKSQVLDMITAKSQVIELVREKTDNVGSDQVQTGLYSRRRWLEAGNFGFRK